MPVGPILETFQGAPQYNSTQGETLVYALRPFRPQITSITSKLISNSGQYPRPKDHGIEAFQPPKAQICAGLGYFGRGDGATTNRARLILRPEGPRKPRLQPARYRHIVPSGTGLFGIGATQALRARLRSHRPAGTFQTGRTQELQEFRSCRMRNRGLLKAQRLESGSILNPEVLNSALSFRSSISIRGDKPLTNQRLRALQLLNSASLNLASFGPGSFNSTASVYG